MFIIRQLGDEAWETDEWRSVEQTRRAEQAMAAPAYDAEPKANHENGWIGRSGPVDDGLPLHERG